MITMKVFGNLFTLGLVAMALLLGFWVHIDNTAEVAPVLLGFSLPSLSLGSLMLFCLVAGVVLGLLANGLLAALLGMKVRRLQSRLQLHESEQK